MAQNCFTLQGSDGAPLGSTQILLQPSGKVLISDLQGRFCIPVDGASDTLHISHLGYHGAVLSLSALKESKKDIIVLEWATASLPAFEVNADRSTLYHATSLVKVESINPVIFERSQSLTLAEGLAFSPALRLENNCQNCGFTQVRMNGLPGNYTQIVLNGRPVFSALTGVYGLEFIPAASIGSVEVLRGGGSALYGSNAIAGILNVVTKSPEENSTEAGFQYTSTGMVAPDRVSHFGTSRVSNEGDFGVRLDFAHRNREAFDANGDGFTEMTRVLQNVLTSQAFWKPNEYSRLGLDLMYADDWRRGGSELDLQPHEAQVAEELSHRLLTSGLTYERYSKDLLGKLSIYGSVQNTVRDSYYGAGGRPIAEGDTIDARLALALNAYGTTTDRVWLSGVQYARQISEIWDINVGLEHRTNQIEDAMPGYGRSIDQTVSTNALYTQLTAKVNPRLSLSAGGRWELGAINGNYTFPDTPAFDQNQDFSIAVGRLLLRYDLNEYIHFKGSYAGGFRLPQAFDEDLHIEAVGGEARLVMFGEGLSAETSHSYMAEMVIEGQKSWTLSISGFHTEIENPFITAAPRPTDIGISVSEKRNGAGAFVSGFTADGSIILTKGFSLSANLTGQVARYSEEELLWEPASDAGEAAIYTTEMLRTPNWYGAVVANYAIRDYQISISGQFTGRMVTPRLINLDTEEIALVSTPRFADIGLKAERLIRAGKNVQIRIYAGCYNILNSFQSDFEVGPDRDATFIYGPLRPRSIYAGIRLEL